MSTTTTERLQVTLVSGLGEDHEMTQAVDEATEQLQELIHKRHLEPAKRELDWGTCGGAPFTHAVAILRERDRYGSRQANRTISRSRMHDPIARSVLMNELLAEVLRQRWFQMDKVIEQGIRDLEQEGRDHGERG